MAQPTSYTRAYSFTNFQSSSPADPVPADQLDAEFNRLKQTTDEILANLALIQRDDGDLANNSVGTDQLSSSVLIGLDPPEAWATATSYTATSTVFYLNVLYRCLVAHTSGTFSTDLAGGKWAELSDFNSNLANYLPIAGGTMTGNIAMGAGKITGLGAATTDGDSVRYNEFKRVIGGSAQSEVTIASGAVTPTLAVHTVDTESDASSDDLDTIAVTNLVDGSVLVISAANGARTVVVKHGTGNISTADGADISLGDTNEYVALIRSGSSWYELFRTVDEGLAKWKSLGTVTASNSTAVAFTGIPSTARVVQIDFTNVAPVSDGANLQLRTDSDNGASYDSTSGDYQYGLLITTVGGSPTDAGAGSGTAIILGSAVGNAAGETMSGRVLVHMPGTAYEVAANVQSWGVDNNGANWVAFGGGNRHTSADVDALQFTFTTGNVNTGYFTATYLE